MYTIIRVKMYLKIVFARLEKVLDEFLGLKWASAPQHILVKKTRICIYKQVSAWFK